jgi:hypothetical protein
MYLQSGDERLWVRQLHQSFERELSPFRGDVRKIREANAKHNVRLPILRRARQNVVRWAALVRVRQST